MQSYVVHFIRHGMTEANIKGQYAGSWDIPVCEQGEEKLKNLRNNFEYPISKEYYTSPLKRCIQTCNILYPESNPIIVDGMRECNFGDWEGKTAEELSDFEGHKEWQKRGNNISPPNGESWADLYNRVTKCFEDIVDSMMRSGVTSSTIFTHGGVIMTILACYGIPRTEFFNWMADNGCGYSVRMTPGMWMRDKVFEVYKRIPLGAESGGQSEHHKAFTDSLK